MNFLDLVASHVPPTPRAVVQGMGDLERYELDHGDYLLLGRLPQELTGLDFEGIWDLHPAEYPRIERHNTLLPRWQQAYGRDYFFSGQTSEALDIPEALMPFLRWSHQALAPWFNSMLLNWYDAEEGHYIGRHRDSTSGLVVTSPIVTLSLGSSRAFRVRKGGGEDKWDIEVTHGAVVVIPWETNRRYTHEVPALPSRYDGRRISITLRAFQ